MPYSAEINRKNPGCLVFLLDQSKSMFDPFGGDPNMPDKAHALADTMNRLLQNVAGKCMRLSSASQTPECWHYFDIAVIGYTTDSQGNATVGSAFSGTLQGADFYSITDIYLNPARIDERDKYDGVGGTIKIKVPVWIDPLPADRAFGTPITAALTHVQGLLTTWIQNHPDNFPPIVFHITDGESTDGDPVAAGQALMSSQTSDGNVLLFNLHVSSDQAMPVVCPDDPSKLQHISQKDRVIAEQFFDMSSVLPSKFLSEAIKDGWTDLTATSRGFAFNAELIRLIKFLETGTRVAVNALK